MKIYKLPPEIIGIITINLDEISIFNLAISCRTLISIVGYYWIKKSKQNIYDIVYDVLGNKLHIIKNPKLLEASVKKHIDKYISAFIVCIAHNWEYDFYDNYERLFKFYSRDWFQEVFHGIKCKYIESYHIVYTQLIYNQVHNRLLKYKLFLDKRYP